MQIIDATPQHWQSILELNQNAMPEVSALSAEGLTALAQMANYFRCIADGEQNGAVVAFLLALTAGHDYDSLNYQWFTRHYGSFLYIDRVVVAPTYARRGIGKQLYADVENHARQQGLARLTCEVNIRPPNPASLAFHQQFGFVPLAQQDTEGGKKRVQLLHKPLPTQPTYKK